MSFTKYLAIHLCFVISEINEYVKRDAFLEKVLHMLLFNFSKKINRAYPLSGSSLLSNITVWLHLFFLR